MGKKSALKSQDGATVSNLSQNKEYSMNTNYPEGAKVAELSNGINAVIFPCGTNGACTAFVAGNEISLAAYFTENGRKNLNVKEVNAWQHETTGLVPGFRYQATEILNGLTSLRFGDYKLDAATPHIHLYANEHGTKEGDDFSEVGMRKLGYVQVQPEGRRTHSAEYEGIVGMNSETAKAGGTFILFENGQGKRQLGRQIAWKTGKATGQQYHANCAFLKHNFLTQLLRGGVLVVRTLENDGKYYGDVLTLPLPEARLLKDEHQTRTLETRTANHNIGIAFRKNGEDAMKAALDEGKLPDGKLASEALVVLDTEEVPAEKLMGLRVQPINKNSKRTVGWPFRVAAEDVSSLAILLVRNPADKFEFVTVE